MLFRPQADDFGFAAERRFIGRHRLRPKEHIRAPGLNIEIARSVIGQVDRQRRLTPGGFIFGVPAEQNPLLIGPGPDDHLLPARSAGPLTLAISLVDFTEKASESTR